MQHVTSKFPRQPQDKRLIDFGPVPGPHHHSLQVAGQQVAETCAQAPTVEGRRYAPGVQGNGVGDGGGAEHAGATFAGAGREKSAAREGLGINDNGAPGRHKTTQRVPNIKSSQLTANTSDKGKAASSST
jgi:hypothetical protein